VKRARQLLRDKNPTAALTELDRLGRLFPSGPLEEEREVLTIEALVGSSGTADLGRRRAERFLAERPQSVHAARVRGLAGR
jgi:outer membrane protein assembly factor BamD (BamD/ComL family)